MDDRANVYMYLKRPGNLTFFFSFVVPQKHTLKKFKKNPTKFIDHKTEISTNRKMFSLGYVAK